MRVRVRVRVRVHARVRVSVRVHVCRYTILNINYVNIKSHSSAICDCEMFELFNQKF